MNKHFLIIISLLTGCLPASAWVGYWAKYAVENPTGKASITQTITAFEATNEIYTIEKVTTTDGQSHVSIERVGKENIAGQMPGSIEEICAKKNAKISQHPIYGDVCVRNESNGILQQKMIWGKVPFLLIFNEKISPLHPRANTRVELIDFGPK